MPDKTYFDHAKIVWKAPEYMSYNRGLLWKIVAGVIVVLAAVLSYLYMSWTFSLAIVTFALVYAMLERENPKIIEVIISDLGVKVGNKTYPFSNIKGFWIIYNPPYVATLNLRLQGGLTDVEIQILDQNPAEIRDVLISKIPEYEGKEEGLIDVLLNMLKI